MATALVIDRHEQVGALLFQPRWKTISVGSAHMTAEQAGTQAQFEHDVEYQKMWSRI